MAKKIIKPKDVKIKVKVGIKREAKDGANPQ
jgi:hypothetical protein